MIYIFNFYTTISEFQTNYLQERTIEGWQGLDVTNQNIFLLLSYVSRILFYFMRCLKFIEKMGYDLVYKHVFKK